VSVDITDARSVVMGEMSISSRLLLCASLVLAAPAGASIVTISGGFTDYSGSVGTGNYTTTINGANVCPDTRCTAPGNNDTGTTSLRFGSPVSSVNFGYTLNGTPGISNLVEFTPGPATNVGALGQEFLLGTFTYTNGEWFGATTPSFGFTLQTHSSNPAFDG